MTKYRQTQAGWAVIVPLLLVALIATVVLAAAELLVTAAVVGGTFTLVLLLFGTLTVTVDAEAIEARFGIGVIKKRVPLAEIRSYEQATTPWYYGWGIRMYPGGWLYNVSGLQSVELFLRDGRRFRFGTAEPSALCDALRGRLGAPAEVSPAERSEGVARSRRWAIVLGAIVVVLLGGFGVAFWLESGSPEVTVDDETIEISSFMYGAEVKLADVQKVTLTSTLPAIRTRTNGFASGDTLRGHFRLDELGDGQLYIELDAPPFVVIEHAAGFVIVNLPDAAQTRALHDRIQSARQQ